MTRLSWDFTGPDPAPGDPAAYARLSRDLGDTAEAAESAYRQLQGLATGVDETIWRGSAAGGVSPTRSSTSFPRRVGRSSGRRGDHL